MFDSTECNPESGPTAPGAAGSNGAVVVFGGAGFIGSHLVARLRAQGAGHIICFDKRAPSRPVEGVEYRLGDIRDLGGVHLNCAVPQVFNLAAVHTTPGHLPSEYYDANVLGAVEITRFARRHHTVQVVFISSISVYGPDETAKDEATSPTPVSDYGRSKRMAEMIHEDWLAEAGDRKLVISRPAVVFGPGEGGNFTRLARMLQKGWFVYPGRTNTIKSCIYVEDLVDWLLDAAALDDRFTLFNAAYSERYTIKDIVDTYRAVAFPSVRTVVLPARVLRTLAAILRPVSAAGLGVHPERIEKLMTSTNILPTWAETHGMATRERLKAGLHRWHAKSGGTFT